MILHMAKIEEISELTRISKEAFDTDVLVGGTGTGGPPEYDSFIWHTQMMQNGNLYTAVHNDTIVGGAILFSSTEAKELYVGRIFIDPLHFRKGYGIAMMAQIESLFTGYPCKLDTPLWNLRTNRFYTKLGYQEIGRDEETVYYKKQL